MLCQCLCEHRTEWLLFVKWSRELLYGEGVSPVERLLPTFRQNHVASPSQTHAMS